MKLLVIGNETARHELIDNNPVISWKKVNNFSELNNTDDFDACFNLSNDAYAKDYSNIEKPVFINAVSNTLIEMKAGKNVVRINGWNGFLKRNTWEVAGDLQESHLMVLTALQKKIIVVPDEPGLISARIISMIINEAYYARADNISTESEIDIAMKLGTNYPLGPFEWAKEIGVSNIYKLLISLEKNDRRYTPCSLLEEKAKD